MLGLFIDILTYVGVIALIIAIIGIIRKKVSAKELSKSDDPEKLFELAKHYDSEPNYKKALVYYQKAADNGLSEAMYEAALRYESGKGTKQDNDQAFQLCLKAAENGFDRAMNRIGYYYENGIGCEANKEQALFWYGEAAKKGNGMATQRLRVLQSI